MPSIESVPAFSSPIDTSIALQPGAELIEQLEAREQGLVREYLAERGCSGGHVIFYRGQICGWRRDLSEGGGWLPGCLALDELGNRWAAMGGNEYDGADRWELIG